MATEEIINTLTDGWRPIGQCFLLHGNICCWNSDVQMILTKLIDDDELRAACEQFLVQHEQCCNSMADVRQLARKFNWPNWNR